MEVKHSVKSHVNIWKMRARIKNTKAVVGEYSQYKVEAERRKTEPQSRQNRASPPLGTVHSLCANGLSLCHLSSPVGALPSNTPPSL